MRHLFARKIAILAAFACAVTHSAGAQAKPAGVFGVGYTDVGPTIGLGGIGGASASFGGRFEKAIKPLPEMGNGILGIQAAVDYYSWSYAGGAGAFAYSWSVKYIPISVTANYHFKLDEPKIDPFVGLGLGYNLVTCSSSNSITGATACGYSAGIYLVGHAGVRYFFSPKMAAYADAGAGAGALHVGLMFKLN